MLRAREDKLNRNFKKMEKRKAPSAPEELRQRAEDASDKDEQSAAAKKPALSSAPPLALVKSGMASAASGGAGAPGVIDLASEPLPKPVEFPLARNGELLRVWPASRWQCRRRAQDMEQARRRPQKRPRSRKAGCGG